MSLQRKFADLEIYFSQQEMAKDEVKEISKTFEECMNQLVMQLDDMLEQTFPPVFADEGPMRDAEAAMFELEILLDKDRHKFHGLFNKHVQTYVQIYILRVIFQGKGKVDCLANATLPAINNSLAQLTDLFEVYETQQLILEQEAESRNELPKILDSEAMDLLGIWREDPDNRMRPETMEIDLEDYLLGLIAASNWLAKYARASVINQDFSTPFLIRDILYEIGKGFSWLSFKNDMLRKRYDSLKYDYKNVSDIIYDLTLRQVGPDSDLLKSNGKKRRTRD